MPDEVDSYFSGDKYNKSGVYIAGSYSWKNGNCGDVDAQKYRGRGFKYRGRGFKMLTGLDKYAAYWVFRGWLSRNEFDDSWWLDPEYKKHDVQKMEKKPASINNPQNITCSSYNCIDTGGFFISCFRSEVIKSMDCDFSSISNSDALVKQVTRAINGAENGLDMRFKMTNNAKRGLNDEVF